MAVQRAKEEHRVNRRIRLREPTGITDFSGHRPVLSCGSDMLRNDLEWFLVSARNRRPAAAAWRRSHCYSSG
jgi:hypothetical protein